MSQSTETVKVKPWGADQGDFVLINASDFDGAKHELYVEPAPAPQGSTEPHPPTEKAPADMTVAELRLALQAKNIAFDPAAKKADLLALLAPAPQA